jgi:hypothetical protein
MGDEIPGESTAVILARMEVKLDQALTGHADHETRIRVLERKVWAAAGFAMAMGTAGGAGLSQILAR